jgi:fatty acid desaturase
MRSIETPTVTPTTKPANEYVELKRRIKAAGLLESQNGYYILKTSISFTMLAASIVGALLIDSWVFLLLDAAFLGFVSTQIGLLSHDVGHRQAFRGRRWNTFARSVLGNLMLGLSHTWWNLKHNAHHAAPNHIENDPDIQMPMFAFSPEQIASRPVWLRPMIAFQAFAFFPLTTLQALNMRLMSVLHLFSGRARKPGLQGVLMGGHFLFYGALLVHLGLDSLWVALAFLVIHQVTFGVYNSSVFASNHKGMPMVTETGRDFLREQVLTSRNVTGNRLTDFWYGGLNYQIEHHLFPTMPRNRLAKAQRIVREFCAERGISYHATSLWQSYREAFSSLHAASASLRGGAKPATN